MSISKKIHIDELLEEFMDLYKNPNQNISNNTGAIIILAGDRPPMQGENLSRIKSAVVLLKKLGKNIPVVFNGIIKEKEASVNLMISLGIPKKICYFQDCSGFGITNTKTQFETLVVDPLTKDLKNLVFVTSTYHIPRVKRTALKFLLPETQFAVVGDPEDWKNYNSFIKVMEEIEKIIEYSTKGDIPAHLH